ncbi:MAG TPA: hypothetical protein VMT49_04120, partial [Steroidobacteraceae bacterium]|nr:hypothetical protein [Steroidobacteraceae bacterium]
MIAIIGEAVPDYLRRARSSITRDDPCPLLVHAMNARPPLPEATVGLVADLPWFGTAIGFETAPRGPISTRNAPSADQPLPAAGFRPWNTSSARPSLVAHMLG